MATTEVCVALIRSGGSVSIAEYPAFQFEDAAVENSTVYTIDTADITWSNMRS
jgi:hypothetical protein